MKKSLNKKMPIKIEKFCIVDIVHGILTAYCSFLLSERLMHN